MTPPTKTTIKYSHPDNNDGVDYVILNQWFKRDIDEGRYRDARWVEIIEESLWMTFSHLCASPHFGAKLERLDVAFLEVETDAVEALASNHNMTSLRELRLNNVQAGSIATLLNSPYLKNLESLTLGGWQNEEDLKALHNCTQRFQHLSLELNNAGSLAQFIQAASCAGLKSLHLHESKTDTKDWETFAQSSFNTTLETLSLSFGKASPEAIGSFVARSKQLHTLELIGQGWKPKALQEFLAQIPDSAVLTSLSLDHNPLGAKGFEALAQSPALASLKNLSLRATKLTASAVKTIANSPHLTQLQRLDLSRNPKFADKGSAALAASTTLSALRQLEVTDCHISFLGRKTLSKAPSLSLEELNTGPLVPPANVKKLKGLLLAEYLLASDHLEHSDSLKVSGGKEGDVIAAMIASHPDAEKIKTLKLDNCKLTDAGVEALSAPQTKLTSLQVLSLPENKLTDKGALTLAQWQWVGKLKKLDLTLNWIGYDGARALIENTEETVLCFEGNRRSRGATSIDEIIDDYWSSSAGERIDLIYERR